ncbi:MAG TPA: DUF6797 domain-containing protein [Candidatus Saccharimonadales bacterium]|nr:DUF6797 domain-containing protein [Candidatus Saccharimonadales bacterium]
MPLHFAVPQEKAATARSQRDLSEQAEGDWVDNRWNQTEIGQFLASNIAVGGARIPKALSIRLGESNEAAVVYETDRCALRAGWTGDFLRFDAHRFGLIEPPKIVGKISFSDAPGLGWQKTSNHYGGMHLSGKRVVLEYTIDGVRVFESPWWEKQGDLEVFTRCFEIEPVSTELVLKAGTFKGSAFARSAFRDRVMILGSGANAAVFGLKGSVEAEQLQDGTLLLHLHATQNTRRFKLFLGPVPPNKNAELESTFHALAAAEDLAQLIKPGPARWMPELNTRGQRGLDLDFLTVDTLTVPYKNPWNALFFMAGVDFTPDGAAYACTIHGDVWRVTGIDDNLRELKWKRFATGLFQPLGLKVRDGQVFVLGRDQITRLTDENGDGEADFYQNFFNGIQTSTSGHDYVTSLEKDSAGNFYYVDPRGAHKVSRDGREMQTLATGFRNANGLGVSPDGRILTVAPQQGEWTPSSEICEVRPGAYFGYGGPKTTSTRSLGYDAPLCWIPHSVDNSSGSQVWVPQDRWGPLGGNMLHLLWGRCGMMLVLRDEVEGVSQGAVIPLPGRFLAGPNRGSFNPGDGQLYVAGSTGWQTSAVKDGSLQRVRFSGKPVRLPIAWHAQSNGLTLTFTEQLDQSTAEDPGSYAVHQWNYRYAAQYGSKDWSVSDPSKEGHDEMVIKSAHLQPDGKTVFLEFSDLKPVMQMEIKYSLKTGSGVGLRNQLWLTLNRLAALRE